jgi:hypothetical protein
VGQVKSDCPCTFWMCVAINYTPETYKKANLNMKFLTLKQRLIRIKELFEYILVTLKAALLKCRKVE